MLALMVVEIIVNYVVKGGKMEKTALQQAIEKVSNMAELAEWESFVTKNKILAKVITELSLLLPTERKQMIDAWDDGLNKGYTGDRGSSIYFLNKNYKI